MSGNNYNSDSEEDNNPPLSAASLKMTFSKAASLNSEECTTALLNKEALLNERMNATLLRDNSSAIPIPYTELPYKHEPSAKTLDLANNKNTVLMSKQIQHRLNTQFTSSSTVVFDEEGLALGLRSGLGEGVYLKELGQGNILIKDQFGSVFHSFQEFCLAETNNVSIDDVVNENFLKSCRLYEKLRKSGDLSTSFKKDGGSALLANAGYKINNGKANRNECIVENKLCAEVINNKNAIRSYHNVDASPFYFSDRSKNGINGCCVANVYGEITQHYTIIYQLVETDSGIVVCSHHSLLYDFIDNHPIYKCLKDALGEELYAIVAKEARAKTDEFYYGWSATSYASSGNIFMAGETNVNIEEVTPDDPIPSSQLGLNESADAKAVLVRFRGSVQEYVDESRQVSLEIEPRDERRTGFRLVGKGSKQRKKKYTYCKAIVDGYICEIREQGADFSGMCKSHFRQFTERGMSTLTPPSDSEDSEDEDEENDEMNASSPNKKMKFSPEASAMKPDRSESDDDSESDDEKKVAAEVEKSSSSGQDAFRSTVDTSVELNNATGATDVESALSGESPATKKMAVEQGEALDAENEVASIASSSVEAARESTTPTIQKKTVMTLHPISNGDANTVLGCEAAEKQDSLENDQVGMVFDYNTPRATIELELTPNGDQSVTLGRNNTTFPSQPSESECRTFCALSRKLCRVSLTESSCGRVTIICERDTHDVCLNGKLVGAEVNLLHGDVLSLLGPIGFAYRVEIKTVA